MQSLALLPNLSPFEILVILVIALLLFGRRLPEVGRSLGKGIIEFKKGLKGVEDDIEKESDRPRRAADDPAQFTDGSERQPMTDERRVSRSDQVDTPRSGATQG